MAVRAIGRSRGGPSTKIVAVAVAVAEGRRKEHEALPAIPSRATREDPGPGTTR